MRHLRYFLATQLFLLLALVLPVVLLFGLDQRRLGLPVIGAWVIVLYSSVWLTLLSVHGSKRLLSLTFWIFVYVWMGVAPMLQLAAWSFPLNGTYAPRSVLAAQATVVIGLIARDFGNWWSQASRKDSPGLVGRWLLDRRLDRNRTITVGLIGALISIAIVLQLGGFDSLVTSRQELTDQVMQEAGGGSTGRWLAYMTLLRVPVFVTTYLLLTIVLRFERSLRTLALLFGFAVLNLAINNPFNSPRYWLGVIVLSVVYVVLPWRKDYSFVLHAMVTVLLLLFVFPHLDLFRVSLDTDAVVRPKENALVEKTDYDAFQQLLNARGYVADHGLSFGKQTAGALLFWVPRGLWPGKPLPSGVLVAEAVGYRFVNLSQPLWGELYLDGGNLGVLLVFGLYGYWMARLERLNEEDRRSPDRYLHLVVPLYTAFQLFLLRGALMSAIAYLTPILGLLFLCTKPDRARDAIAPAASTSTVLAPQADTSR